MAPLATPPPSAVQALATQPSSAYPVPTNVATAAMAAYPGEDPLVGKTLVGRYAIVKKLGEGGMGAVYLATHIVLEKQVALKILHGEYARKADLVERFMQEAKAASRIRHENVIDISDFGVTEEGLVFFAMELLKGNDLHELVARARLDGQVLPWDRTRHIFLQICAALAAAHSHGIVHRDLKPENVYLIEFLGRPDFVKLLDFGIAKLAESEGGERKLTRTGMLFGTPEYMSPEQARGDKVDHRVDIYAMACILFQLLTGRVPFEAENFMGVLSMHLTEPPPEISPATLERCGAPPEIAAIVAKGLRKNRDERWQTIEEMAAAIRAADGGPVEEPVHGVPAIPVRTRTQWTGKLEIPSGEKAPVRRSKVPLVVGGLLVAAGAAAAGVFFATRKTPSAEPGTAIIDSTPAPPTEPPAVPAAPGSTSGSAAAVAETPPANPTPAPPPPLPEKVTLSFTLAKGVTLYDAAGKVVADASRRRKTVEVVLPGSDVSVQYLARGKGMPERRLDVIPDRDASFEVGAGGAGVIASSKAGDKPAGATPTPGDSGATTTPSGSPPSGAPDKPPGDKPPGDKPPGDNPPGDNPPGDDDIDPSIKNPFKEGSAAAPSPSGGTP